MQCLWVVSSLWSGYKMSRHLCTKQTHSSNWQPPAQCYGRYLSVCVFVFCFVLLFFCFKTYLREMQIKNILIKSESNVKDKWKMQLWNKQCRKNSNYCHPTCKIPERLSRNKLQWLYVIWTRFFFKKPCFTLCFVYKNVKYTFHLLWKLVRCESHFKLILITQV